MEWRDFTENEREQIMTATRIAARFGVASHRIPFERVPVTNEGIMIAECYPPVRTVDEEIDGILLTPHGMSIRCSGRLTYITVEDGQVVSLDFTFRHVVHVVVVTGVGVREVVEQYRNFNQDVTIFV